MLEYCHKHAECCKLLRHRPFVKVHKKIGRYNKGLCYVIVCFIIDFFKWVGSVSDSEVCRLNTIETQHSSGVTNVEF